MTNESHQTLLDVPEVLSPKLKWMRKHNIETGELKDDSGDKWTAWLQPEGGGVPSIFCNGQTEEEALVTLAMELGIKDWRQA